MSKPPLNYTTRIAVTRTSMECMSLLGQAGADHVAVSYVDKEPVGLTFVLSTEAGS